MLAIDSPVGDERPAGGGSEEGRDRSRLRLVAGAVILGCIVFLVVVDALGRLFVDRDFHVGDIFIGSLLGALLLVIGVEGASRLPWSGPK